MSIEAIRELETLASVCPELNMTNYTEDDVRHLNDWAIEMSLLVEQYALSQQPAQATQAEVTDAEIVAVMRDGNNCNYNDEAEHIQFARAILALRPSTAPNLSCRSVQARLAAQWGYVRPAAVPMTDEQIRSMCKQGWVFETVRQWVHVIEAHHGISTQAKKEKP